ncbi:hypothetical protein OESDEN_22569 [Oesophagostomum dentatum]|uniref:Uncharacterized protein n=1 Tax=Oesophagostomum dentatum TaxID=61180 RepID=A0A0B1S1P8_OESDE|nr:hypothetical protein OESDEN_22569 [Oesophagostomum dentatum]
MALNLISSYDSDTDSNCSDSQSTSQEATEGLEAEDAQSSEKKSSFFFGGDDADSNDEEEDSQSKRQHVPEDKNRSGTSRRLPSAMSVLKGHHTGSSVFSSEKEQEDLAQQFTLSQHVPLTEKVETKKKPVCSDT